VKPYVLVIEDEDAILTLLEYNFEKEGYDVGLATDGEMGLLLAEERTPDFIICDWMMPKLSGVEVCRRLRRKNETRATPIIMLTARGEEADKIAGLDFGADDYIGGLTPRSNRISAIRAFHALARTGVFSRTASGYRLGSRHLRRSAHRRCAHWAPPKSA